MMNINISPFEEVSYYEHNGNKYDKESFENAIKKFLDGDNRDNPQQMMGTLNPDNDKGAPLTMEELSHVVNNITFKDGKVSYDIKLLDTPKGKIAQEMLKNGYEPDISLTMLVDEMSNRIPNSIKKVDSIVRVNLDFKQKVRE